jgi:hypothetical protein
VALADEIEAVMKKSFRLCLRRVLLSASLAVLCACEQDAPAEEDVAAPDDAAAEDAADDASVTEDPSTTEDASEAEDPPEMEEDASPDGEGDAPSETEGDAPSEMDDAAVETEDAAEPDDEEDAGSPRVPSFLPWQEGNTWTYRVTNSGAVSTKVVTIMAAETVGGSGPHADEVAFKVVTSKGARDQTISWQALRGDAVVRFREQSFHAGTGALELEEHWSPYKLHFDGSGAHTMAGASWFEEYEETKLPRGASPATSSERDRWIVDSPEEKVTVPAGTFRAVVVIKAGGSDLKTYWYARGVGKVKETGGQTEELVSYDVSE